MKIAWFTPLSNKSAIGRASVLIVRELAKLADVEVWHSESGPIHSVNATTTFFRNAEDPILERLAKFDLIFYNFGNHLSFHRDIFLTASKYPGVAILHDFVMHHFFASYYLEDLRDPAQYMTEMERLYGTEGRSLTQQSLLRERIWETDQVVEFPMFETAMRGALGVITHSQFFLEKVSALRTGPVCKIPLPYELPRSEIKTTRESLGIPKDQLIVLTVGHANPNKRLETTIKVIGSDSQLCCKLHFLIAGPCDPKYQKQLEAISKKYGMQDRVQFLGYVSDEHLQLCLTHADICVNLRYPAFEGASASVIEEMYYGKPVVVSDTGFYKELPSDCVRKIRPHEEQQDLRAALLDLLDSSHRTSLGQRAREFAAATFLAEQYAREVVRFAWDVRSARPVYSLADRVASEFGRMGIASGMELPDTVSEACAELFFKVKPAASY